MSIKSQTESRGRALNHSKILNRSKWIVGTSSDRFTLGKALYSVCRRLSWIRGRSRKHDKSSPWRNSIPDLSSL